MAVSVLVIAGFLIAVWRREPRGPGQRFRQKSKLAGGPIGPGVYRGVDAKKERGSAPENDPESDG